VFKQVFLRFRILFHRLGTDETSMPPVSKPCLVGVVAKVGVGGDLEIDIRPRKHRIRNEKASCWHISDQKHHFPTRLYTRNPLMLIIKHWINNNMSVLLMPLKNYCGVLGLSGKTQRLQTRLVGSRCKVRKYFSYVVFENRKKFNLSVTFRPIMRFTQHLAVADIG
jgi:hypothetical protein